MSNVTLLAIDLAKNVFQLYATDAQGKKCFEKRIRRSQLLEFVSNVNRCTVYMEGCGSANYWGRKFIECGHQVKLINPKYVKPYVKRQKTDKNDSYAIASAARDHNMTFSNVKTQTQQDIQGTHRIRSLLISQRTALVNQIRGLLAEYGIVICQGVTNVRKRLPIIIEENEANLSWLTLNNFQELYQDLVRLDEKIKRYDGIINSLFITDENCKRLAEIPGIGKLGATILSSTLGNGSGFKNGRHFAAFLGLTPKQHSSGEKEKLLGISKGGDTYIRTLLIHGARAVLLYANKKTDNLSMWLKRIQVTSGNNKAAVAMANKMARMAWAIVKGNCHYTPDHKPILQNSLKKNGRRESLLATCAT